MIYYLIKIFIQLYYRVYFRRIYIHGAEKIPKQTPVFIAANHPNGFLDGTIVTAMLIKPTYIFVRGDVFKKAWANLILRDIRLIPIFRARDGELRESVIHNNRSYDQLYEMFKRNKQVMIFPEAISVPARRLRPLRKGAARIILDMESREDGRLVVPTVPAGLNYSFYKGFGKELIMNFNSPLHFSAFKEEGKSESFAINNFTKAMHTELRELVIHIPEGMDHLANTGFALVRGMKNWGFRVVDQDIDQFKKMHRIAQILEEEGLQHPIGHKVLSYQHTLDENNLSERTVSPHLWEMVISYSMIIPAALSRWVLKLPFDLGRRIADKKVKAMELYDSVIFGVGVAVNIFVDLALVITATIAFGWKGFLIYTIFRWLAVFYASSLENINRFRTYQAWKKLQKNKPDIYDKILDQRKEVMRLLEIDC